MEAAFFFYNTYFIISLALLCLSLFCFQTRREKLSLAFLFLGTFALGFFMAGLDPFINLWDEQYHALVAKNLIKHPLTPVLIEEPLFGFKDSYWSYCKIWIHKQPLFLWQMALSIHLFGLNELAVRLPSVLMHALLVFFIYRIGKITVSKQVGYYSALFFSCAYFPLEFVTGFYATDHNDVAFFFYSFASFWALIEYHKSQKRMFILLIGLLSGCAILCKWLTGLLPYLVWFIIIVYKRKEEPLIKNSMRLCFSVIVCMLVFLPWQIYAYLHYPKEYLLEMEFNRKHIFVPLEGHGGNYFFYYDALFEQFGEGVLIPPLVLACFVYMMYSLKNVVDKLAIVSTVVVTYLFFTCVATKMYGYVFVVLPFFIMGLAFAVNVVINKLPLKNRYLKSVATSVVLLAILFLLFDHHKIYKNHSNKDRASSRLMDVREKYIFKGLKEKYGDAKCLVFNCKMSFAGHIVGIFYTGYPCFNYVLTKEQVKKVEALHYHLFVMDDGKLPEYVTKDDAITKIKF